MTLAEYREKYTLKYRDLHNMTGLSMSGLKKWADRGATVKTSGKQLLAIYAPRKQLWPQEAKNDN